MRADLILLGGRVSTQDPAHPEATALACAGERVVAVGADHEVASLAGPHTRIIVLAGRRVTPGFIDSHLHLSWLGLGLEELDLRGVRSLEEMQRLVAGRARGRPDGSWILGRGWDHEVMGALPSRHHLDAAAPGRPVLLTRVCGHVAVASTRALEAAGIGPGTPDPPGGAIDRDALGRPTGVLREAAVEAVRSCLPPPGVEELARALEAGARHVLSAGITSVHSNDGTFGRGLEFVPAAYRRARELGMRLRVWWDFPGELLGEVIGKGWRSGTGDGWFRVGSAKFFADGSLGGGTAALSEPYADAPGSRGILTLDPRELAAAAEAARRAGVQLAVHAIGDRAVETVLGVLEGTGPWTLPPRLIHCQVMREDLFPRMRACGVVADLQPRFVSSDQRFAEKRLGPARARLAYAWRVFLDHGIPVAFGSDCPVEPVAPMLGVFAAVTRCDTDGRPPGGWFPEHRLSVEEAVRGFTVGAARAVGEEEEKGSLSPGKLADLVVWEPDPFTVEPMALKEVRPLLVVVGGQVVYEAGREGQ